MRRILSGFLLLSIASPVMAAELQVRGTAGAQLFVDGEAIGTLPLSASIELEAGPHTVLLEARGYVSQTQSISLGPDETASIDISLTPLRRSIATGSSLLLAGMGQIYEDRHWQGFVFLGLQLGAAVTAILSEAKFKDQRDELDKAQFEYDNAIDPGEIEYWRTQTEEIYADLEDTGDLRDAAVIAVAATAVLSAIEAWWHFPQPQVDLTAEGDDVGLRLGIGGSF